MIAFRSRQPQKLAPMEKKLIGFTTSDGKKHLGFYTPVPNPCGDCWEENSVVEIYTDEFGCEYNNVINQFHVDPIECYYWDNQMGDKQLLPAPALSKPTTHMERTASIFSEDIITNDRGVCMGRLREIREWLTLNTRGAKEVYIDKEFVIHSKEKIQVNSDAAGSIPEFIHFGQ